MHTFDWGQFIVSTVSVLLLLGGIWWWAKRSRGRFLVVGGLMQMRSRIQLFEVMPLSLKHKMVLIQVDKQMVLATVSSGEVKALHVWSDEETHAD